jgi:hypothetical protein
MSCLAHDRATCLGVHSQMLPNCAGAAMISFTAVLGKAAARQLLFRKRSFKVIEPVVSNLLVQTPRSALVPR